MLLGVCRQDEVGSVDCRGSGDVIKGYWGIQAGAQGERRWFEGVHRWMPR